MIADSGVRGTAAPHTFSLWRITVISALCGLTALVVVGYAFSRPFTDFGVYYTAAHLFAGHQNPYSLPEVFAAQKALGFDQSIPVMFLCPPWVLTVIAPLGYLHSYVVAWLCWLAVLIAAVAIASKLLMDVYFGSLRIPEISYPSGYRYLFAFTFYPVLMALKFTQFSPLVFLGIAGYLHYQRKCRPFIAGLLLSMTLLKPHLVLLLWLALLLDREWKTLCTAAAVAAAFSTVTLLRYPAAFNDYGDLMTGPYPALTVSGVFAGIRGAFENPNNYWLQYIPAALGLIWTVFYWYKNRMNWTLTDRLPALITASVMAAPYGYTHDQILLMIAIVYLASRAGIKVGNIPFYLVALYTALNVSILLVLILAVRWAIIIAPLALTLMLLIASRKKLFDPGNKIHDFDLAISQP
jgi:hypothetical protein